MSLQESRILNSVHPWLKERLVWLGEVARIAGGDQTLISGRRSLERQRQLYDTVVDRPVAFPGCSQHNYGFAADVKWGLIIQSNTANIFGIPVPKMPSSVRVFSPQETDDFMESAARYVQLQTISGDPGHLQIYPGATFRNWSVGRGLCNPNPPRPLALSRLIQQDLALAARLVSDAEASANFLNPFFIWR